MIVNGVSWRREIGYLLTSPYRGIDRRVLGWMRLREVVFGDYSFVDTYASINDPLNFDWIRAENSRRNKWISSQDYIRRVKNK